MKSKVLGLLAAALLAGPTAALAAAVTYSTDAAFVAAAGGSLTNQSFASATQSGSTTVSFSGGTFSCSGPDYCPGFFGVSTGIVDSAAGSTQSVFFASPDKAIFTFAAPINDFGIVIGGAGDCCGPITLTAGLSNGDSVLALNNYQDSGNGTFVNNSVFFGVIDSTGFTSITFTPSNTGDGVFFDVLSYGTSTSTSTGVPEPAILSLAGLCVAAFGFAARRKAK